MREVVLAIPWLLSITQVVRFGGKHLFPLKTTLWLLFSLYHTTAHGGQGMTFSMGASAPGMWAVNPRDDQLLDLKGSCSLGNTVFAFTDLAQRVGGAL